MSGSFLKRPYHDPKGTKIIRWGRIAFALIALIGVIISAIHARSFTPPVKERAASYWIWAGVGIEEDIRTESLYIYQGIIRSRGSELVFERRGLYPHPTQAREIHLVFRLEKLDLSRAFREVMLRLAARWKRKGNRIAGFQIDYDAPTAKLGEYHQYLRQLRSQLPVEYRLSITGLGDWLFSARPGILKQISEDVGIITFQLYQGGEYVKGLPHYIRRLETRDFPFKVGLLLKRPQNAQIMQSLQRNTNFQGPIYFLRRTRGEQR